MTKLANQSELIIKINEQQDLAQKIRDLQAQEKKLRASILEELFGTDNVGTQKQQVDNAIVTGTYGLTYKFDQSEIEEAIGKDLISKEAADAVRVKFELDKKAYDNLSDEASDELDDYLTIKPSLPSLKVTYVAEEDDE